MSQGTSFGRGRLENIYYFQIITRPSFSILAKINVIMVEMGRHAGHNKGSTGSCGTCASSEAGAAHAIWKKISGPDSTWSRTRPASTFWKITGFIFFIEGMENNQLPGSDRSDWQRLQKGEHNECTVLGLVPFFFLRGLGLVLATGPLGLWCWSGHFRPCGWPTSRTCVHVYIYIHVFIHIHICVYAYMCTFQKFVFCIAQKPEFLYKCVCSSV